MNTKYVRINQIEVVSMMVFFAFSMLSGCDVDRGIIWSLASIIIISFLMLFGNKDHLLVYLALYMPWSTGHGANYTAVVISIFLIAYFVKHSSIRKVYIINFFGLSLAFIFFFSSVFAELEVMDIMKFVIPSVFFFPIVLKQGHNEDVVTIARVFAVSLIISIIIAGFGNYFPRLVQNSDQASSIYNTYNYFESLAQGRIVRFSGLLTDANFMSCCCLFAASLLFVSYQREKIKFDFRDLILIIVLLCSGALSISTTYFVCLIFFMVVLVLFSEDKRNRRLLLAATLILIIGFIALRLNINTFLLAYTDRVNARSGGSFAARIDIWRMYLEPLENSATHFLFGYGYMSRLDVSSHNVLIRMAYMFGVAGAIAILLYLAITFLERQKNAIHKYLWLVLFLPLFVYFSVLDYFRTSDLYFMFFYITILFYVIDCDDGREANEF